MNQRLFEAKTDLIAGVMKKGIETNLPLRDEQAAALKKLMLFDIMRTSQKPEANHQNLPYLVREAYHDDVVTILRGQSIIDPHRKPCEKEPFFFAQNIYVEKNVLLANPDKINFENAINWLTPENISNHMQFVADGKNHREIFTSIRQEHEQEMAMLKFAKTMDRYALGDLSKEQKALQAMQLKRLEDHNNSREMVRVRTRSAA